MNDMIKASLRILFFSTCTSWIKTLGHLDVTMETHYEAPSSQFVLMLMLK